MTAKRCDLLWKGLPLLLGFLVLILVGSIAGLSAASDDGLAVKSLQNGIPDALLISYPLGKVLTWLYALAKGASWYSYLILLATFGSFALHLILVSKEEDKWKRTFLILLSLFFHTVSLIYFTITTATLLLYISSFAVLVKEPRNKWAIAGMALSLFMRPIFAIKLGLGIVFILYAGLSNMSDLKHSLKKSAIYLALILVPAFFISNLTGYLPAYQNWDKVYTASAQVADHDLVEDIGNSPDLMAMKLWHPFEVAQEDLGIKLSAGAIGKHLLDKLSPIKLIDIILSYRYWFLMALLPFMLIALKLEKSKENLLRFVLVGGAAMAFFILVVLQREVFRVSFPLLYFIFISALFANGSGHVKNKEIPSWLKISLLLLLVLLVRVVGIHAFTGKKNLLKMEEKRIVQLNQLREFPDYFKIPSVYLPYEGGGHGYLTNFGLFSEHDIPDDFELKIAPFGWMGQHPYQEKWLHNFGFNSFYELEISPQTYFYKFSDSLPKTNSFLLEYLTYKYNSTHSYKPAIHQGKLYLLGLNTSK